MMENTSNQIRFKADVIFFESEYIIEKYDRKEEIKNKIRRSQKKT